MPPRPGLEHPRGRWVVGPRQGARQHFGDLDLVLGKEPPHVRLRLHGGTAGRVAQIDRDHAHVGDDVVGDPCPHRHGTQRLPVHQPVDDHLLGDVFRQSTQHSTREVRRVGAHPRPGRVRPPSSYDDVRREEALTAALQRAVGGFHQDGQIGVEEVRALGGDPAQTVAVVGCLLALVEDVGDVSDRCRDGRRGVQGHGDAALHVARTEPVQQPVRETGGQVAAGRDGVQVPGDHHALGPSQLGAGDHGVADPLDPQMGESPQRALHHVGECRFRTALGRCVDQRACQLDEIRAGIECGPGVAGVGHGSAPSDRGRGVVAPAHGTGGPLGGGGRAGAGSGGRAPTVSRARTYFDGVSGTCSTKECS